MIVIYLTPATLVAPESAFRTTTDTTIYNQIVLPTSAGKILGLTAPLAIKALHHRHTNTFAFIHNGQPYRAFTPIAAVFDGGHFAACKACRDGQWCAEGLAGIQDAMGVTA